MGISMDEVARIRQNRLGYIHNIYPLVEERITRQGCSQWMVGHGYPVPPRSACTFCPFHSSEEWLKVKEDKDEWEDVVNLDKAIRLQERFKKGNEGSATVTDELFLHRDCVPIDQINFDEHEGWQQLDLFTNECEGMCGV